MKQIIFPFYCGLGGPLGNGKQYFPWIHVHDLCRLLLFSIENSNVNGILNGVAPQVCFIVSIFLLLFLEIIFLENKS